MRWFPSDRKGRKVSQMSRAAAVNYFVSPIIIFSLQEFRENVVSVAESLTAVFTPRPSNDPAGLSQSFTLLFWEPFF